ncbi:MAG: DNA polymerase Y family protein [Caldimonas sp.]
MLWIALHLPSLSLESFAATLAADPDEDAAEVPLALIDAQRIVGANAAAQALGVKAGLKRATALALAPQLTLGRADRARDAQALEPVAHAALAFTPSVAIQPADSADAAPHTVLLEVDASLRYFGGLRSLLQRLQAALRPLRHRIHVATAPTAQGAALLARLHRRLHCADLVATRAALDAAPVWLLGPGSEHWDALQGMGLRTLGDLRSLPRAGLARRFGAALLNELDRALGDAPDPRVAIALPPVFESRLELFARADTTEQVLHGASLLLARLVLWLTAQHAFVRRFTLVMQHEARWRSDGPRSTALEIALAEPARDSAHLLVLLRERLARLQLPAPTLDLLLRADDIARRAAPNHELFPTSRSEREGLTQLIERLQARLGAEQVQRLQQIEDHRPECGSRIEPAGGEVAPRLAAARPATPAITFRRLKTGVKPPRAESPHANPARIELPRTDRSLQPIDRSAQRSGQAPSLRVAVVPPPKPAPRPVWLLSQPEPLPERRSRPLLGGEPLQLLSGPERIEAGWWDSAIAERDYFIAQTADGALVWIYRARLPLSATGEAQGWFMQGRFG